MCLWRNIRLSVITTRVFIALTLYGCGQSGNSDEARGSESDKQIRESTLLEVAMGSLSPWVNHWEDRGLVARSDVFTKKRTHDVDLLERPEVNPLPDSGNPLADLQLDNPEGKGVVDIYDYKINVDDAGQFVYEPDAEVIYYKENGMRERILFVGPSGLFEEAAWIDGNTLVVGGYFENEEGFSPMMWVVFMDKGVYDVYETSFVIEEYPRHSYVEKKISG